MIDKVVMEKWAFDSEVTACFDDMLRRSIPQYEEMRQLVFQIGKNYYQHGTVILDIGCSRGEALARFVDHFGDAAEYMAVDSAESMVQAVRDRWPSGVEIACIDLRDTFPVVKTSIVLAILTIQFIPIEYRQRILSSIYDSLVPGGCLIFVEKVMGAGWTMDKVLTETYLGLKLGMGYSEEQVIRKRSALEGVLVPVTAQWNEDLLKLAGFRAVDCFWRCLNFAGWAAIK